MCKLEDEEKQILSEYTPGLNLSFLRQGFLYRVDSKKERALIDWNDSFSILRWIEMFGEKNNVQKIYFILLKCIAPLLFQNYLKIY